MRVSNNRFIYLVIMALTVGSYSCKDMLDIPPEGKLEFSEFWQSKEQSIAAIAGIYSNLGSTNYNFTNGNISDVGMSPVESYIFWGELRGELVSINPGKYAAGQLSKENVDNFSVSAADVTTKYTQFYKIINEANQAIKYIPGVRAKDPAFTEEEEANLMGEAYFLRGYAYFWLLRTFKEVPLILEPSETDDQNYDIPKASTDTLLSHIVKDLELSKRILPSWYSNQQYSRCRANKYTAMTVLSDVYLTMASLTMDETVKNTYYDQVISNCDAVINSKKYTMVPGISFGSLFTNGNTDESIFETYSNSKVNAQINNLLYWFFSSGTSGGYFIVPVSTDQLFTSLGFADYRGSVPPKGPYPAAGSVVGYASASRFISKYSSATRDARWIFYRYPDVLLMKAEALAHRFKDDADKLSVASGLVNQVRFRAFGINDYPKASATSTYEMDNILLDERGREFLGEGKRWFELVRFASRDNFAYKALLIDRIVNSVSGVTQLIIAPRVSNPDSWYLPLNAEALDSSPSLVQNPYYQ